MVGFHVVSSSCVVDEDRLVVADRELLGVACPS